MPRPKPVPRVTAADLDRQWSLIRERLSGEMTLRGATRALRNPWVAGTAALLGGLGAGYCLAVRAQSRERPPAGPPAGSPDGSDASEPRSPLSPAVAAAVGGVLESMITLCGDLLAERLREAWDGPGSSPDPRKEAV